MSRRSSAWTVAKWREMNTSQVTVASPALRGPRLVLGVQGAAALLGSVLLPLTDLQVHPAWFDDHRLVGALLLFLLGTSLLALQFELGRQRVAAWLAAIVFQSTAVGSALAGITQRVGLGLVLALVGLWTLLRRPSREPFLSS